MSVLVKGMEMPKNCGECPMLEGDRMDGLCHAASKWLDDDEHWTWYVYPEGDMDDSKPCNCPLVEVDDNEIDEALKALKGVRDAYRIITEVFCRPPETDIGSKPK